MQFAEMGEKRDRKGHMKRTVGYLSLKLWRELGAEDANVYVQSLEPWAWRVLWNERKAFLRLVRKPSVHIGLEKASSTGEWGWK